MSDLQCPATFLVVGPARACPAEDPAEPVAAVHAAPGREVPGCAPLEDGPLWSVLADLADLYRGCRVVVLAARVEPPLTTADAAVLVRIDADGASLARLP